MDDGGKDFKDFHAPAPDPMFMQLDDLDKQAATRAAEAITRDRERTVYRMIVGDDTADIDTPIYNVLADVVREMRRADSVHPAHPSDPLRFTALMVEEAGEALTAALDLTRPKAPPFEDPDRSRRMVQAQELDQALDLYKETCHTASKAIHNMVKLRSQIDSLKRSIA